MKKLHLTPFILLLALGNCSKMDCFGGTRETKPKLYQGDPNATKPYGDAKPKFTLGNGTCTSSPPSCQYFPMARLGLHNPTNAAATADVTCDFFVGDWKAVSNKRLGIKVPANRSVYVEIQQNITVEAGKAQQVGVSCDALFK